MWDMNYSISDVARRAGVSTATVSRVMNNKTNGVSSSTRERVLAIMEEMNYRPSQLARSIALNHSNIIGVIIPDVSNLFYPQMLRGIDDYLNTRGYSMMLFNSDSDPEREKKQLLSMVDNRVDGVILCSGVSNEAFLKEYRTYGMPLALIGRTFDSAYADCSIIGDNEQGMYDSASLMLSHGHKRILYLDGTAGAAGPIYRLRGYRHALQDGGVTPDEGLILRGEFSIQFGYDMVLSLLDEGKEFTAIVSGSDLVAIGAIKALRSRGIRVPEDIEVMGFDNIELSEIFEPKLSTVSKPHYEIASQAAKMLISTIENEELPIRRMTVASTLILRDTTR
ncbi:MAG: LacI family DNA-binding transcriptional regulator [Clostridia bacterium]|nr:LacI family DNA-binding transcriptional regulator [Clostridia bacterium]